MANMLKLTAIVPVVAPVSTTLVSEPLALPLPTIGTGGNCDTGSTATTLTNGETAPAPGLNVVSTEPSLFKRA